MQLSSYIVLKVLKYLMVHNTVRNIRLYGYVLEYHPGPGTKQKVQILEYIKLQRKSAMMTNTSYF